MKPRVFFLFQKKVFHHLPLVGTWARASFRQAPKTFSSSLPPWLPFLSRSHWINFPRKSKKHILASSQRFTFSLLLGSPLPALHSPPSFPSSSPAGCTCPDTTACHPQSARPSRSVPLKTKFILRFVCYPFVPCLPNTLRALPLTDAPPSASAHRALPAFSSPASPTTDRGNIDIHSFWALLWIILTCKFPGITGS